MSAAEFSPIELSIAMPCLNEAQTLATCIEKARKGLRSEDIPGQVLVADNGSTEGVDFGNLPYPENPRRIILAVTLKVVGLQTVFSSFFLGVLGLKTASTDIGANGK
jgi:hypothetical protein